MKRILLLLMIFVFVGCSGPSNKNSCIPSRDAGEEQALDGSQVANAQTIDEKLADAKIISTIVEKIKEKVVGGDFATFSGAQQLFEAFVSSPMLQNGISAAFMLYIIIFGVLVITGMAQVTLNEAVVRVIKMSFITIFALNWAEFYGFIGKLSMDFTDEVLGYFLGNFSSHFQVGGVGIDVKEQVFEKLDFFVARTFSMKMAALISALFFTGGPSGPAYALLIILSIFFVFKAILTVVLVYCFSLFARAMLFAIAPIFFAFMLFKPTQPYFDSWVKQLINYSLQPVLTGAFLGFFLAIMEPFFQEFLKYQFCWRQVDATKDLFSWGFIDPQTGQEIVFGANSKPAVDIQRILLFLGFGYVFYSATKLGQSMAAGLAGTVAGNLLEATRNMGGLAKGFTGSGSSPLKSLARQS